MEGNFDALKAVLKNGGTDESEIETDEEFEVLMKTLFALGLPKQTEVPTSIGTSDNLSTYAFRSGNYSFAALLANNGASSDEAKPDQAIVLFAAVKRVIEAKGQEKTDELALLETILKCKIDPNIKSSHIDIFRGATPLLIAAQNQDLKLAKLLVAYGADLDLRMEIKEEDGSVKETCVEECCKERGKESFFKKLEKVKNKSQEQGAADALAKEGTAEPAPRPRSGAASSEAAAAAADDTVSMRSGVSRVGLLREATASSLARLGSLFRR